MELSVELIYIKYDLLVQNASKTRFETIKYWIWKYEHAPCHSFQLLYFEFGPQASDMLDMSQLKK